MKVFLFFKKKKKGQATIEAVLIMLLLFLGVRFLFGSPMKDMMDTLFDETPKSYLKGMVRDGVWKKVGNDDFKYHPNAYYRTVLTKGESLK